MARLQRRATFTPPLQCVLAFRVDASMFGMLQFRGWPGSVKGNPDAIAAVSARHQIEYGFVRQVAAEALARLQRRAAHSIAAGSARLENECGYVQ